MARLDITTVIGCSVQCQFCPQTPFVREYTKRSNIRALTLGSFNAILERVPLDVDLVFAGFTEPWLNPHCTRMVQSAYQAGHKNLYIATTLVGMTPQDIDSLEAIPFKDVRVHLPSTGKIENIKVDENYMSVLQRLAKSPIKVTYRYHGKGLHPQVHAFLGQDASRILTIPRSVSVPQKVDIHCTKKKEGVVTCGYDPSLHFNELLPNGDVLLCCHDWSMRHILGNLLEQDYESLFLGQEFLKIQKELQDSSSNIICRNCLISRHVKLGRDYWKDLLNTDIRILWCKAVALVVRAFFLNNHFIKKILYQLKITTTKIDFGDHTLNDR